MKNEKLKLLIADINVLIYIHDILSLKEKYVDYQTMDLFKELYENDLITRLKYLKRSLQTIISFIAVMIILQSISFNSHFSMYLLISIIAVFYGIFTTHCLQDLKEMRYQLRAKKAVQFALENYSYNEYVFFLDQYLSEESTKNHYLKKELH